MAKDKTKSKIVDAFRDILVEKAFSKITVQEIAEKAQIERQTFYYHFKDIEDMLDWAVQRNVKALKERNLNINSKPELYSKILYDIKNSDKFVKAILTNAPGKLIYIYLSESTRGVLEGIVEERIDNLNIKLTNVQKDFVIDFYNYGTVATIIDWIKKDMQEDPELLTRRIHSFIHNTADMAIRSVSVN